MILRIKKIDLKYTTVATESVILQIEHIQVDFYMTMDICGSVG